MDDKELEELQNPDNWEQIGEVQPPVKEPRAVVSVAFSREDFDRVVERARAKGMKTSEYVRHCTLREADSEKMWSSHLEALSGVGVTSSYPQNRTRGAKALTGVGTKAGQ